MRRFRILFVLVAAAVLVPMVFLVRGALRSVDLEREMRHQVVADRLFDEMERALSTFLEEEEERPFSHYAPPAAGGAPHASPLRGAPALPFVRAYVHVDSRKGVSSPGRAGAETPASLAAVAEAERAAAAFWRRPSAPAKPDSLVGQAPGTTVELKKSDGRRLAQKSYREADEAVSAYDALRSLNKGVEQRVQRKTKVADEPLERLAEAVGGASAGGPDDPLAENEETFPTSSAASVAELSPMSGARLSADRLLLFRTALHEGKVVRQGLLLDVTALGDWLREQVIESGALGEYASFGFVAPDAALSGVDPGFVYQHRFAFPFEDLTARLTLALLPGVGGAGYVVTLSVLLLLVAAAGLVAIERMVTVALRYAEQRSNFVAAVTHELRTPLTAIRMYGEMLRDGIVASEAKRDEYHRHITAESERLTRLVNNVLELARLEKSARRTPGAPAPLAPVLDEAAGLARPHAEAEGFAIRTDVEPDLPPVRFDRDALLQVLFNLVDNAVKYANGTSPKEITLVAKREGGAVVLAVRDRGPGVPPRQLGRIFEPFHRGTDELTRRTKGTGIGLALVRGLAAEMGARVSGRNLPGGGFEVSIAFPDGPAA